MGLQVLAVGAKGEQQRCRCLASPCLTLAFLKPRPFPLQANPCAPLFLPLLSLTPFSPGPQRALFSLSPSSQHPDPSLLPSFQHPDPSLTPSSLEPGRLPAGDPFTGLGPLAGLGPLTGLATLPTPAPPAAPGLARALTAAGLPPATPALGGRAPTAAGTAAARGAAGRPPCGAGVGPAAAAGEGPGACTTMCPAWGLPWMTVWLNSWAWGAAHEHRRAPVAKLQLRHAQRQMIRVDQSIMDQPEVGNGIELIGMTLQAPPPPAAPCPASCPALPCLTSCPAPPLPLPPPLPPRASHAASLTETSGCAPSRWAS